MDGEAQVRDEVMVQVVGGAVSKMERKESGVVLLKRFKIYGEWTGKVNMHLHRETMCGH